MDVTCPCGTTFQARSSKARYCSDRCRKRKGKADALVVDLPAAPEASTDVETGPVAKATRDALVAADRLNTPMGQASLALARRLDSPALDTGSAMAAVAKTLDTMLASATKGAAAASAPDALRDELAERRRKHGA